MRYVIGIDEVGRGPLAGPVTVAAILIPKKFRARQDKQRVELRDSKKLTEIQRRLWSAYLLEHPDVRSVAVKVYPATIDRINISKAANLAAYRAYKKLLKLHGISPADCEVYLDGGLYLGNGKGRLPAKTIIKGDEKIPAIAMASIIAKVTRDRIMVRAAKIFPEYGFGEHKGYGTKAHYRAIRKLGLTKIHRASFV